ncbi:hypothetical protein [Halalkalibaculum sp. DA384]|uniref:hypothetical protein n=1 Tax=Halalkalibaculum sp. DA384 TaxID=3373606 RepID=UPI0037544770
METTYILNKELKSLQFSVWDKDSYRGHSHFVGDVVETAKFLRENETDDMEVSALDLEYMHSLEPIPAVKWLIWYYQTALTILEENDFDEAVLVPYPSSSLELVS